MAKAQLILIIAAIMALVGCKYMDGGSREEVAGKIIESVEEQKKADGEMRIRVENNGKEIVFKLNGSPAAKALYSQLPLTIEVENFGNNEKIFYPPEELDTTDTPLAEGAAGTLAYYAPWGDVVMFFGSFSRNSSLYGLGTVLSGSENIAGLSGELRIERDSEETAEAVVYMATDISPEGLMAVYEAMGWEPEGKVAVKLSTGEPPASNYLSPDLIKGLVQQLDGTIVECNTAYGGSRASTAMHLQVAKDHGFTAIADVDIQDAEGSMPIPVAGGTHLAENFVGTHFADYSSYLVLSHFKGHSMAGFGGAVKNISIGLGSSEGKAWIHSGGTSRSNAWGGEQDAFLESMAEAGKSVSDYLGNGDRIAYVNVCNRLSVDCDCDGNPAEPDMHDIGILASTDPVALDQACVDLVYAAPDGQSLIRRIESRNGIHTLEHAEGIGLGSRTYRLVEVRH